MSPRTLAHHTLRHDVVAQPASAGAAQGIVWGLLLSVPLWGGIAAVLTRVL